MNNKDYYFFDNGIQLRNTFVVLTTVILTLRFRRCYG
ncbi:MAG: hypothetical protein ACLS5G_07195 [Streptococcus sp.]